MPAYSYVSPVPGYRGGQEDVVSGLGTLGVRLEGVQSVDGPSCFTYAVLFSPVISPSNKVIESACSCQLGNGTELE